jgi:hypothetical protein
LDFPFVSTVAGTRDADITVPIRRRDSFEWETTMNMIRIASGAIAIAASVCAFAQGGTDKSTTQAQPREEPGKAGQQMQEEAGKGVHGNASGTLMDKRAKAMSPEGASASSETAPIKQ